MEYNFNNVFILNYVVKVRVIIKKKSIVFIELCYVLEILLGKDYF